MRKKPWRTIRSEKETVIRKICYSLLILELAVLCRRADWPFMTGSEQQTEIPKMQSEEMVGQEDVYGFRVRLRDGTVELYRKEVQVRPKE